jgi:hypothetical protein
MFAQGGLCFFCKEPLPKADASIEHLVASANGGRNHDDNCVACCKALNALFGSMSLKEKIQIVLNQRGRFTCPNGSATRAPKAATSPPISSVSSKGPAGGDRFALIVSNLKQRGSARPRTVRTLSSTVASLFQNKLTPAELAAAVRRLELDGIVTIKDSKVSYAFPDQDS